MPAIGYVTKLGTGGFKGHIKTLSIRAEIELLPNSGNSLTRNRITAWLLRASRSARLGSGNRRTRATIM